MAANAMADEIRDAETKKKAVQAKAANVQRIEDQVSRLEKAMSDDVEQPRRGCFSWLFGRRARVATSASIDQAVFGQRAGATNTAAGRLTSAAASMEAHADALGERASAARSKAKLLMAAGKKAEALAWLKKAKQAESQHSNAVATHAALERQIDVLEESALQKEVATALSASVAVAKKKVVGLMSKTEDAVDSAVELKDFAEDVSQVLGGLQGNEYDDDELMEELQAMEDEDGVAEPVAIVEVVKEYPTAPTRGIERKSLLSDDGAVVGHAESL